ncbi:MAG: hypothetical protein DME59_06150 [Verrucomicrobia bacterium]|nr:MAG: hypothetical protein DME59_06150 [Verrucomicrobiota bacterium]PYL77290.1 MAG: hypothetical protein DMF26_04610 [Verrucomicrobiota bacterium]
MARDKVLSDLLLEFEKMPKGLETVRRLRYAMKNSEFYGVSLQGDPAKRRQARPSLAVFALV